MESNPAIPSDEEDRALCGFFGIDEGERVRPINCLCDLKVSCCARRRKVQNTLSSTVGLAVELVDGAAAAFLPGASGIVDPSTDEMTGQLVATWTEVV